MSLTMLCLYDCSGIIGESVEKLVDESGVEMGVREVVEKDAIELARQKLIAATLGHQDDERYRKKSAVKQLIGTLIAARKRGLSFDRMAGLLGESGVEIAPDTLRAYYFELKTEAELSAEQEKHAKQLARIQQQMASTALAQDLEFAALAATEHVAQRAASRVRVNAFGGEGRAGTTVDQPGRLPAPSAGGRKVPASRQAAPATTVQQPGRTGSRLRDSAATSDQDAVAAVLVAPERSALEQVQAVPEVREERVDNQLVARTIEEVAAKSVGKTVTDLTEDIEIRDNCVWYASGKPFDGFLGAKHLHLLRTVGKVIAPTSGRSSKDFVVMSQSL